MKISIITVVYNNEVYIEDCINSVLSQSYNDVEYIIIDGASTDGTLEKINHYNDRVSKIISEPDRGIYDAMNKGISHATGDIVGILNSDDVYASDIVLENVHSTFLDTATQACYGDLVYVNHDKSKVIRYWKSGDYTPDLVMKGWMPPHPTFFVKRELYVDHGKFNTDYNISADYEFILRLLAREKIQVAYIPEILVQMRIGGESNASIQNLIRKMKQDYKAMGNNGISFPMLALFYKNASKISQFFKREGNSNN